MANRWYNQFARVPHHYQVTLDCNFQVASTSGAGVTNLKGPGIAAVYMHSSAPSSSNPNPAAGYILVQLQDSFNRFFYGNSEFLAPNSGSNLAVNATALTVGAVYVITALGTTTAAQWIALGVPSGVAPAVGLPFIAKVTGVVSGGTGSVQAPSASGITNIEIVGQPNLSVVSTGANVPGQSNGSYLLLECLKNTAITQPADGTLIYLQFAFSNTQITIQGE